MTETSGQKHFYKELSSREVSKRYLISEQSGIFAFPYGMVAARGTAWGGGRLATMVPELKICLHQTEESLFRLFF